MDLFKILPKDLFEEVLLHNASFFSTVNIFTINTTMTR
jgi:hypothetical protein